MIVEPYSNSYRDQCIDVFISNQDRYFDESELIYFKEFLSDEVFNIKYYVVSEGKKILGCGGYSLSNGAVYLRWGMVSRSNHRAGVGSLLLQHRINHVKKSLGSIPIKLDTSQHTAGFFKKFGFEIEEEEENGFGSGLHKVSMCFTNYHS